jgi:ribosomal protein S8
MSNYIISDSVSYLTIALKKRLKAIDIPNVKLFFEILTILYKQGLILNFKIIKSKIRVFFKFYQNKIILYRLQLISIPSNRVR